MEAGTNIVYIIFIYMYTMDTTRQYKRNPILPFTSAWMDLKAIIASEKSQTEKSEYCMISLMCVIQKYDKVENIIKKKQAHRHRKGTHGYQLGEERGRAL